MVRGRTILARLIRAGGARFHAGRPRAAAQLAVGAALADALLFLALDAAGLRPPLAHVASFAAAAVAAQLFDPRWRLPGPPSTLVRALRLGAVAVMALALRGGVLGVLVRGAGLPAAAAVGPVVLAGALVLALGCAFWVFAEPARDREAREARWSVAALGVCAYVLALRLLYVGLLDLVSDEAYYWQYARHLDLAYLDHPPMVAWLIAAGTAVAGTNELGVRLGALLCGVGSAGFAALLARDLFGASAGRRAALLVFALPYFLGAGSLLVPDAPVVLFWSASLFFLERALLQGRAGAWWGAGASLGLGLLSKYTIALLGPAALVFVLADPPSRRWLRRFEPWAAAALAALLFSPVLVWNLENDWASFRFQSVRRMQMAWEFGLPELLLDCALLVTPAVLVAVWLELWGRGAGEGAPAFPRRRLFLGIFLGVPLAVFVAYSFQHRATFHWTGPIWLAALPLAARSMTGAGGSRWRRGLRRSWGPLLAGLCVAAGVGVHALAFQVPRLPHTQLSDRYYWSDAAPVLAEVGRVLEERTGQRPLFVGMSRWAVASSLAFYAPSGEPDDVTSRHLFGRSGGMYERWLPPERALGRPVVLVAWQRKSLTGGPIHRRIEGLGPIRRLPVRRDGRILRRVYVRTGLRYLGP